MHNILTEDPHISNKSDSRTRGLVATRIPYDIVHLGRRDGVEMRYANREQNVRDAHAQKDAMLRCREALR